MPVLLPIVQVRQSLESERSAIETIGTTETEKTTARVNRVMKEVVEVITRELVVDNMKELVVDTVKQAAADTVTPQVEVTMKELVEVTMRQVVEVKIDQEVAGGASDKGLDGGKPTVPVAVTMRMGISSSGKMEIRVDRDGPSRTRWLSRRPLR